MRSPIRITYILHAKLNLSKEITVQYTKDIIDSLKAKSSCGVDGLSVKLLKLIKDEISTSLTLVINQSLLSGIFPDQLKIAKVIPIYIRKMIQLYLVITDLYRYCQPYIRYSKR